MADVLGSFSRGFALGEQVLGSMERRERREKQDEREETLWQQSQEDRKTRLADAQTARERGEIQFQQQQEDRKFRLQDAQTARERGETQWQQQQETYKHNEMLRERQVGEQLTADWLNGMAERGQWIDPPLELEEYYDNNPHLDISNILMPNNVVGRQQARKLMQEMAGGKQINYKDPRLTQAITELFPEIIANKSLPTTYKGKQITKREVGGVIAAEDGSGFMVQQRLTLDDGTVVDEPVTQNRTSDPNDDVAIIPFEMASSRLATYDEMDLGFDDESKQQLMTSRIVRGLAKEGVNTKDSSALKKQMLSSLDTLEKEEAKALSGAADYPEEQAAIKQTYKEAKDRVRTSYQTIIGGASKSKAPEAGRTPNPKLRADTIKTINTMAEQNGIDVTPELRAEIEQAVDANKSAEQIFAGIQRRYGDPTEANEQEAEGIVDAVLADLKGSRSGELGEFYKSTQRDGVDIPPPTIQPTETPTGTPEEIAARARQAQAGGRTSPYSLAGADEALAQAYGGRS